MSVSDPRPSTLRRAQDSGRTGDSSGRTGGGFTLIELAIAAGITVVVFAAVATATAAGLSAWRTSETMSRMTREGTQCLRALERDLTTAVASAALPFSGQREGFTCSVSRASRPQEATWTLAAPAGGPAFAEASAGGQGRVWTRHARWLTGPGQEPPESVPSRSWRSVEEVALAYPVTRDNALAWVETWPAPQAASLPAAVRVTMTLRGPRGQSLTMTRTIDIPAGVAPSEEESA